MEYKSREYALITGRPNEKIFRKVVECLSPRPEDRILEIGCGRGFLVKKMLSFSKNITGIDISPWAVSLRVCSNVRLMDATQMDFSSECFDKIYSNHTIEHIPKLKKFFRGIDKILKPGGKIVLVYPWELIRGTNGLKDAILVFKNPLMGRKLHLHKLNPKKIRKLIEGSRLYHQKSCLVFAKFPQYLTVLKKK